MRQGERREGAKRRGASAPSRGVFRAIAALLLALVGAAFLWTRLSPPRPWPQGLGPVAPLGAPPGSGPSASSQAADLPPRPFASFPLISAAEQGPREALARDPGDAQARARLAAVLLAQRRPFGALWHLLAAEEPPAAETARALLAAGLPEVARAHARDAVLRAEIALAVGRPEEVVGLLGGQPPSEEALLLLGDAHAAMGEAAAAEAAYRRAARAAPESAAPHDRLGRLALAARDWQAAQAAFVAARERDPTAAGAIYRMGVAFRETGQSAAAEQLFQVALERDPSYAPARVALGEIERQRGRLTPAAAHLVAAVRARPSLEAAQEGLAAVMTAQGDRASALYQRGFFALQTERPYHALRVFEEMTALAPERVDGPLMAGFAWIQMKQLDRAAEVTQKGLERHPGDSRLLERLATLHVLGRNRPRAKEVCAAWLKAAPESPGPYRLLSRIAREEHRLPEAVRYAEQAVERDPNDAAACYELSKALAARADPARSARALELARRAAEQNPREADHWHHLGLLLQAAGQPEEAAEALARALDGGMAAPAVGSVLVQLASDLKRPNAARFFASLVTALEARRREADALTRAVYLRPADVAAQARLADHLLAYADLERARYRLEEVVRLRPGDASVRERLAVVTRLLDLRAP